MENFEGECMRLFRLFDENGDEIAVGVYNERKCKSVVSMPSRFPKYKIFYILDPVLKLACSFMWCCPNAKFWHGHEDMNEMAE